MRNREVKHSASPVLCHHDDVLNISVGNDINLAFEISQNGRPQSHTFDVTGKVADLHNITDAELVFKQDEETGDDIFNEALRAETNGQSNDTGTSKYRPDVESEFRADRQYNN